MSDGSAQLPPGQHTEADTYGQVVINAEEFPALAELVEFGADVDAYLARIGVLSSDFTSGPSDFGGPSDFTAGPDLVI